MSFYYQPDVDALKEVISSKKAALKSVKSQIAVSCLRMLQEQDVAELKAPPHPLATGTILEIQQLQVALDAARERAESLEKSIAMHTALLPPPAHTLPVEIWSYIFILYLGLENTSFLEWNSPSFPPSILGSVCTFWRSITLSNPYLWSSVSIHIIPGGKWKNKINLFLERSGTVPLSLELIWHPAKADPHIEDTHTLLIELVVPHLSRWRSLQLFVPYDALRIILGQPLPNLEYLALASEDDDPVHILGRRDHAPKLRHVSFATVYTKPLLWDLPWAQLTELSSKSPLSGPQVLLLFQKCPLLERCRLRVIRYHPNVPEPEILVVMPRLQSIIFVTSSGEDCLGLLNRLVLPSLTLIEFHTNRASSPPPAYPHAIWPKPHLVSLISRSGCALERLVSVGLLTYEMEIRDTVKCIPSLISFEVYYKDQDIVPSDVKSTLLQRRLEW